MRSIGRKRFMLARVQNREHARTIAELQRKLTAEVDYLYAAARADPTAKASVGRSSRACPPLLRTGTLPAVRAAKARHVKSATSWKKKTASRHNGDASFDRNSQ